MADMSNWKLQEGQTSVSFPHLSKDISQGIFGNLSEVSFQVRMLFFFFSKSIILDFGCLNSTFLRLKLNKLNVWQTACLCAFAFHCEGDKTR